MVLPVRPPALLVMRRATGLWIVGDGWQRFSGLATKPVEWPQFQISAETSPDDASARFDCQRKRDRNLPWLFGSAGLELNMPDDLPASRVLRRSHVRVELGTQHLNINDTAPPQRAKGITKTDSLY